MHKAKMSGQLSGRHIFEMEGSAAMGGQRSKSAAARDLREDPGIGNQGCQPRISFLLPIFSGTDEKL